MNRVVSINKLWFPLFLMFLFVPLQTSEAADDPIGKPHEVLSEPYLLGSWTHLYEVFPSRNIARAGSVRELKYQRRDIESIAYRSFKGKRTLRDYIHQNKLTSLLVLHDEEIAYENYFQGTGDDTLFTSWSMAKSVTSTLLGLMLSDGTIGSVDDIASRYVPELRQSGYHDVRLRDLLQMSSGVRYREGNSDPESLEARSWVDGMIERRLPINHTILWFDEKHAEPGAKFTYASIETQVVGWVIERSATKPLAEIFSEKIWKKIGAEHDASWVLDKPGGTEIASCCINATTRDYGRLGLLFMNGGRVGDEQVVPKAWMKVATSKDPGRPDLNPGQLADNDPLGYQHFWWLWPLDGAYSAFGHGGQWIYVNPEKRIVIVQTAVWNDGMTPEGKAATVHAFLAIVKALEDT